MGLLRVGSPFLVARFIPLSQRGKSYSGEFEQPVEGLPDYLLPSLHEWVRRVEEARIGSLEKGQVVARLLHVFIDPKYAYPVSVFWGQATTEHRLNVIDLFVRLFGDEYVGFSDDYNSPARRASEHLEWILASGGSAWRVSFNETHELTERVDETIQDAARTVIELGDDAGRAIARAWSNCYGRNPNYDEAYRNLVLAVESAIHPLATPNDPRATLGKARAHIADTKDRWTVAGMENGVDALLSLLGLIWVNQERHAQPEGTILGVGKGEAEAALSAALTVIQWSNAGAIRKAS